ncbi:DUF6193 family natural product biosynthesis protein [Streptomyces solincola]|uniref:DUF6193 family natural product biosynthesis protein n=1 Tax=Streptomyces solincola TaxID=2100817 RepID=UPI001C615A32|nr:DUF6193 family natural product biosynthesis protein [Streptomyces solincola]
MGIDAPRSAAEIVAEARATVLTYDFDRIAPAVPRAAYAHQSLRQLWPMVSHGVLYLSRCTRFPWTDDVGTAYPLGRGGYRVRRCSDNTLLGEVATVEEAYAPIAADLPDGCGPAIEGTPHDVCIPLPLVPPHQVVAVSPCPLPDDASVDCR